MNNITILEQLVEGYLNANEEVKQKLEDKLKVKKQWENFKVLLELRGEKNG